MDLTALTSLKPSAYEEAADGYRAAGQTASRSKDEVENGIAAAMRGSLRGEAAEAALAQLTELTKNFHYIQVECGLVSAGLNAFAADVLPAKRKLDAALADAAARRFTIGPDGSVGYPAGGHETAGHRPEGGTAGGLTDDVAAAIARQAGTFHPNPHFQHAQACANLISEALAEATAVDRKWAPALRRLMADDDLTVSNADWSDAAHDIQDIRNAASGYLNDILPPPGNGTPEENAEWWTNLSDQEKAACVALYPAQVGALDGLPAEVRDEANRTVLDETHGRYELELATIPPEPSNKFRALGPDVVAYSDEWLEWRDRYLDRREHLEGALRGMNAIQERFDHTGVEGLPEAYLLGFSPEGTGRAIIANGNPDTADHTAVYVPGTTSNLSGIDGGINRMETLWKASNGMAGEQSVSTVTWQGYDAPQTFPAAASSQYANSGGLDFNSFMDGLHASNTTESGGHHTVVGHSYGTTLIGSAARQGNLMADDVILAGSPGVQVGKAADLDVPEGHVWNENAAWDPVPPVGSWGHGGTQETDTVRAAGPDGYTSGKQTIRGITPDDQLFGANQMATDTSGHTTYWDSGSKSLLNQAAVITGRFGDVQLEG